MSSLFFQVKAIRPVCQCTTEVPFSPDAKGLISLAMPRILNVDYGVFFASTLLLMPRFTFIVEGRDNHLWSKSGYESEGC